METSLMSESVVDAADVEETVTQVLTHFVQGGDEQAAMSVQLLAQQVETCRRCWCGRTDFLDFGVSECMY